MLRKVFIAIIRRIVRFCSMLLPIDKSKVCVCCFAGKSTYNCNPKYICDELIRLKPNTLIILGIDTLILGESSLRNLPPQIKTCDIHSIKWEYHLLTSLVWIDNHRKTFWKKRSKTLYVNTWHGSGLIKKCEGDSPNALSNDYIKLAKKDSKNIDVLLSDCDAMTDFLLHRFWYSGYVMDCGYARYKPLFENHQETKIAVLKEFGISTNKRIILYTPTFRSDYSLDAYNLDSESIINACSIKFGGEFVFLYRFHPNLIKKFKNQIRSFKNCYNASYFNDVQLLLASADVLISDFSSTIFDFTICKKPAFRYIADLDEYINDRNTCYPLDSYPWPLCRNSKDLIKEIESFEQNKYNMKVQAYYSLLGFKSAYDAYSIQANFIFDYMERKLTKEALFSKYKAYLRKAN